MGSVPAIVDMQPLQPSTANKATAKGTINMDHTALLVADSSTAPSAPSITATAAAPAVPTWDPHELWKNQKKWAWVLFVDTGIYFIISMVTLSLLNILVSACGLAGGIVWFATHYLRFGTMKAVKAFYWPGLVGGIVASLCAITNLVVSILKLVDSPIGGSLALPFRIVFIVFNAIMGACCLWIFVVGYRCKKCIEAQLAAQGPAGMMERAKSFISGLMPSRTTTAKMLLKAQSAVTPTV